MIRIGSRVVLRSIVANKYVMLVESGVCDLPGGGLKVDETPRETVQRELYEETHIELIPEDFQLVTKLEYRFKTNSDVIFAGWLYYAEFDFKFEDITPLYPAISLFVSKDVLLTHVPYLEPWKDYI